MCEQVTAENLNDWVEFDSPFTVAEDGTVSRAADYSPTVHWVAEISDIEIESDKWEAVSGFSGQYSYAGPIMHPSEYLGGGMANWVLETPGTYAVTAVEDSTEDESERDDLIGWVLLCKVENA